VAAVYQLLLPLTHDFSETSTRPLKGIDADNLMMVSLSPS